MAAGGVVSSTRRAWPRYPGRKVSKKTAGGTGDGARGEYAQLAEGQIACGRAQVFVKAGEPEAGEPIEPVGVPGGHPLQAERDQWREEQIHHQQRHEQRLNRDGDTAVEPAAQAGNQDAVQRGGREGGEQAAGQHSGDVSPKDAEKVLTAIHAGPHEHAEEIYVQQEYPQKDGEGGGFGQEEGGEAHGMRGQHLVVAAVGKERVPFEDHQEAHHGHGERNEHIADRDEVPAGEGKRAEQKHEESAGDGQNAEGLSDSGLGISLGRE